MDRPGLKLNVALKSRLGESPSDTAAVKQLKHADGPVGQGISSLINLNYPMKLDEEVDEMLEDIKSTQIWEWFNPSLVELFARLEREWLPIVNRLGPASIPIEAKYIEFMEWLQQMDQRYVNLETFRKKVDWFADFHAINRPDLFAHGCESVKELYVNQMVALYKLEYRMC